MWRMVVAILTSIALPVELSAGPLSEAAERAGRQLSAAQHEETPDRGRARFWTGMALIAGGGALATLGALEVGDDESGPDDGEDADDSDDGEDSDGWGNKALLGGGIAAAGLGTVVLLTGRKSGPVVSTRGGRIVVRHTVRF